jgi:Fe-S-cluster containining protein
MSKYDCTKCPGFCCSYPQITLEEADVQRIADHYGVPFEVAARKYTRADYGEKWVMRRKRDEHYGKICRFFDLRKRNCTIYAARPAVCRGYPNDTRCGYWDFLKFERKHQQDPNYVATTDSKIWP